MTAGLYRLTSAIISVSRAPLCAQDNSRGTRGATAKGGELRGRQDERFAAPNRSRILKAGDPHEEHTTTGCVDGAVRGPGRRAGTFPGVTGANQPPVSVTAAA
jgi:hypothetical protein